MPAKLKKRLVENKPIIQDVKPKQETDLLLKAQMWKTALDIVTMYDKQDNYCLSTQVKTHFREPYAMHIIQDSNKITQKMVKASVIYDEAMSKDERYTLNDQPYNPYVNNPISLPPVNYFNNLNSLIINNFFIGYGELSLIGQNPIISNICEIIAHEVIGKWIKIISTDKVDRTKEIKIIEQWFKDKCVKELFKQAIRWALQFGGCMIYPKLKGDDKEVNGQVERSNPILMDNLQISRNDVEYLTLIEPIWYTAINWQSFDPLKRYFYKPQKYTIMGRITHATRLMHFKYKEVSDILKPTYMFNGQPLSQEILPYLMGFEQSRNNINQLIAKYNHFVLKTNIETLLNDTNSAIASGQNLGTRIAMFNKIATANNVVAIDKESEDFDNISLNLTGVCDVQNQNMSYVCSIARIPITKLFQNSLPGLNPTGEFETNSFYDTIREHRANMADAHLYKMLQLSQLDSFGEIYDSITYEWEPLEEANELELSQINLNKSQEASQYVTSGIVQPVDAAKKVQNDKNSGWESLEINEKEYKDRQKQMVKQQEQQSKSVNEKKQDK